MQLWSTATPRFSPANISASTLRFSLCDSSSCLSLPRWWFRCKFRLKSKQFRRDLIAYPHWWLSTFSSFSIQAVSAHFSSLTEKKTKDAIPEISLWLLCHQSVFFFVESYWSQEILRDSRLSLNLPFPMVKHCKFDPVNSLHLPTTILSPSLSLLKFFSNHRTLDCLFVLLFELSGISVYQTLSLWPCFFASSSLNNQPILASLMVAPTSLQFELSSFAMSLLVL